MDCRLTEEVRKSPPVSMTADGVGASRPASLLHQAVREAAVVYKEVSWHRGSTRQVVGLISSHNQAPKLREASNLLKTRRLAEPSESSELPVHALTSSPRTSQYQSQ